MKYKSITTYIDIRGKNIKINNIKNIKDKGKGEVRLTELIKWSKQK